MNLIYTLKLIFATIMIVSCYRNDFDALNMRSSMRVMQGSLMQPMCKRILTEVESANSRNALLARCLDRIDVLGQINMQLGHNRFLTNPESTYITNEPMDSSRDSIDVLDEFGKPTGEILSRKAIHTLGKIHRAVHLYVFDKDNNLLLQRRSPNADHYPSMFSISVTGHIDAGEGSKEAVRRELQEELGLFVDDASVEFLFSLRQDIEVSPTYIDRQFNDVYACWLDFKVEDIAFSPDEVSEVKLIPFSEFEAMVKNKESDLAPVYEEECTRLVSLLQGRMDVTLPPKIGPVYKKGSC